jgi:sugar fermentation stimulation protein A
LKLEPRLIPATLVRRYKRFLADVLLSDGITLTVHTPNTGSMLGVSEPGSTVWLRDTCNSKRKYRFSWEMSETISGIKVGVHTGLVNRLVMEGIGNGVIKELQGYENITPEVVYGNEQSRIDLLLSGNTLPDCYVEIKNVTATDDNKFAIFPDAVTTRGQKHLRELISVVREGKRGVIFFCIQREDVGAFRPADEIDPVYGDLLREAMAQGVEAIAYSAFVTPGEIRLTDYVPVNI